MPSILVHLDEPTLQALSRAAPASKRDRAQFIRQAIKDAIRKHEYARIREAYRIQPDSAPEIEDWSCAEEWKS
jgi:predicted transcriptional regulator